MIGGHARSQGLITSQITFGNSSACRGFSRKLALVTKLSENRWIAPHSSIGVGLPVKFIVAVMRRHWPRGYCRWRGYLSNVAGDDNSPASHKRFRSMPYRIFRDIE